MNTVNKGNAFERRMVEAIESMLANDKLPVIGKYSKVYPKKAYYSEKRKGNIIVDIAVECTLPGESVPSVYLIIECKDYSHAVPVDDVEEFYTKVGQITGLNVKAIFLCTSTLQQGALNFAQSTGMRVMRILPEGKTEVLSYRKERSSSSTNSSDYLNATLALTSAIKSSMSSTFVGIGPGKVYHTLAGIFGDAILDGAK